MPPSPSTHDMGDRHEKFLAEINGGTQHPGSGNQWTRQGDGSSHPDAPFAFTWDGKSTLGQSVAISLAMIRKIREQAQNMRPQIGIRFYGSGDLSMILADWIAIQAVDFSELLDEARRADALRKERDALRRELDASRASGVQAAAAGGFAYTGPASRGVMKIPPGVPMLPWTVISQVKHPGGVRNTGLAYDATGRVLPFEVQTVVVERSEENRPRLYVNGVRQPGCDLYVDGGLAVRAAAACLAIEVG